MRAKKPRYGLWAAILVLIVALTALLGTAIGKYIATQSFSGTLQITAELGEIKLVEHQAVRQADGSYELNGKETTGNSYILIPGLDIPKDPHIIIKNKTSIPSYLFVEVVGRTNNAIAWEIAADWKLLDGVTGANGGLVYVYDTVLDEGFSGDKIYILKENQIEVKQELLAEDTSDTDTLVFYACMGEKAAGDDAAAVYQYYYPVSP